MVSINPFHLHVSLFIFNGPTPCASVHHFHHLLSLNFNIIFQILSQVDNNEQSVRKFLAAFPAVLEKFVKPWERILTELKPVPMPRYFVNLVQS